MPRVLERVIKSCIYFKEVPTLIFFISPYIFCIPFPYDFHFYPLRTIYILSVGEGYVYIWWWLWWSIMHIIPFYFLSVFSCYINTFDFCFQVSKLDQNACKKKKRYSLIIMSIIMSNWLNSLSKWKCVEFIYMSLKCVLLS